MARLRAVCGDGATGFRRLTLQHVQHLADQWGLATPPLGYRFPGCDRCSRIFEDVGMNHEPIPREDASTMMANWKLRRLRHALDRMDLSALEPVNQHLS